MLVVTLDPGETTGYAVYDTDTEELVTSGELFGNFRDCVRYVLSLGDVFVLEEFRVRPGKGVALSRLPRLWPVEWMGALRYALGHFETRTPAQVHSLPERLFPEAASEHELDALRLLRLYLDPPRPSQDDLARALSSI